MRLHTLITDDGAVSTVIGVVLMVAITVILAATIGTFALGFSERRAPTAPQASLSMEFNDGGTFTGNECDPDGGGSSDDGLLNVTHASGDELATSTLEIHDGDGSVPLSNCVSDSEVTAGVTFEIAADRDDTIRLVWQKDGETATIAKWTGPEA